LHRETRRLRHPRPREMLLEENVLTRFDLGPNGGGPRPYGQESRGSRKGVVPFALSLDRLVALTRQSKQKHRASTRCRLLGMFMDCS
jgi:hypothetical protein